MFREAKSNRIIYEREKVKDHVMHIERLRMIKPTIQINRPKKPSHLKTNAKREMQNLERMSEIQYQNRILLRKMLQIDLKKSNKAVGKSTTTAVYEKESNPNGLNAYNSLNRAVRIKEIARVADDNRNILGRLQQTKSHYNSGRWAQDAQSQRRLVQQVNQNGDRFCKNPYFLHSVCTQEQPYYASASLTALSASQSVAGGRSTNRGRSARSGVRNTTGKGSSNGDNYSVYTGLANSSRPMSAPKAGAGKRTVSAGRSKRKARVQSGRVKQISEYLSQQEQHHQHMVQGMDRYQEVAEEPREDDMDGAEEGEEEEHYQMQQDGEGEEQQQQY